VAAPLLWIPRVTDWYGLTDAQREARGQSAVRLHDPRPTLLSCRHRRSASADRRGWPSDRPLATRRELALLPSRIRLGPGPRPPRRPTRPPTPPRLARGWPERRGTPRPSQRQALRYADRTPLARQHVRGRTVTFFLMGCLVAIWELVVRRKARHGAAGRGGRGIVEWTVFLLAACFAAYSGQPGHAFRRHLGAQSGAPGQDRSAATGISRRSEATSG
jgi:hypothetical protein